MLPSLGENDVAMSTADRLVADALGLAEPAAAGHDLRRVAGEVRLADEMAEIVRRYQAPAGTLTVLVDGDPATLDEHALAEARATAGGAGLPHNQARALFKDLVVDFVADEVQARARVLLAKLDEDIEVLTGGVNVDKAAAGDLARLGFAPDEGGAFGHAAAVAELDPGALRAELVEDLALERAVEAAWPRLEADDLVLDLLDGHPGARGGGHPRRLRGLDRRAPAADRRGGAPAERPARPGLRARGGRRGPGADADAVALGAAPLPWPLDDGGRRPGAGRAGDGRARGPTRWAATWPGALTCAP